MTPPIALASIVGSLTSSLTSSLTHAAAPWKHLYDDSKVVATIVVFVHLAALLAGGGLALATDRATLRAAGGPPTERERHIAELGLTHGPVVASLAVAFVTGALLFLADVETFATSLAFWAKMALVALLLLNGWAMTRVEARLRAGRDAPVLLGADGPLWRRLRLSAVASAVLWFATLLLGVALTNS
ncbi:MAG: hypothetical protein JO180_09345 [Gemmatirosa sp.]|nr:hypothetical protein [Gemmatirosa sp.]